MYEYHDKFVFEPVLREVENFSYLFSKIKWLGFERKKAPPLNTKMVNNKKIDIIPVKSSGGKGILKKIGVILLIPYYFIKIFNLISKADVIHTRGPSVPALIAIILLFFYPNKKKWYKYGGSWQIVSKSYSYRFQRWLLLKNKFSKVIVGRKNKSDPDFIYNWLNPCLTKKEIIFNNKIGRKKVFNNKFILCFIGRLELEKGFYELHKAITKLPLRNSIKKVHFVGDMSKIQKILKKEVCNNIELHYHGILGRNKIDEIYKDSHFIILPSKSEGFPKVLAEAASFGCIPIIPPIDSILKVFNEENKNGFILKSTNHKDIINVLITLEKAGVDLSNFSRNSIKSSELFSYDNYNEKILNNIL